MKNFYNLFKFLEDKKGIKVPLTVKILYAPETITKKDLNVEKGLSLYNVKKEFTLPDNLTVGTYLTLNRSNIKYLPDNLTVGVYLDISYTEIDSIPNNLIVDGTFYVRFTPLAEKYSKEEIFKMIRDKGGIVREVSVG